jgi:hypothetical protein
MQRRLSMSSAALILLVAVSTSALLGYLLRHSSEEGRLVGQEHILSRAAIPPKLPRYDPGAAWPQLPPKTGEVTEPYTPPYEPEVIPSTSFKEGGGGSGRPHGITFGR